MAQIELEIDDIKGEIVGDAPEALKAILARIENTAHGQGYGKGAAKAAEEAKAQIASAIAAEKTRLEELAPLEREKYQQEAAENRALKQQMLEAHREANRQMKSREEEHATQLLERTDAVKKRNEKIVVLTKAQLRNEAKTAGARDESLDELEVILHASVGYTDDMEPYVRQGDGTPRMIQGKPITVPQFVKEYLDGHQHHRRAAGGTGGGARGGASFQGHTGTNVTKEAAQARIEAGDRSPSAVNEFWEATRTKRAS